MKYEDYDEPVDEELEDEDELEDEEDDEEEPRNLHGYTEDEDDGDLTIGQLKKYINSIDPKFDDLEVLIIEDMAGFAQIVSGLDLSYVDQQGGGDEYVEVDKPTSSSIHALLIKAGNCI